MNALDNIAPWQGIGVRNARQCAVLMLATACAIAGLSCRNSASGPPDPRSDRSVEEAIAQAEQFYAERTDVVKVRQGLIVLRQALAANPSSYEVAWRLAKFNYYLGSHTAEATEQEKAFHDGTEAGKLAVKLDNAKPEGHFWLGANYGGNAEVSTLAGLAEIEDIKHEMLAVLRIDEAYEGGSAYMALGQVFMKAPRILGGDLSTAIEYIEKGIKVGPNNGLMRLRLAQAYADAHRNDDARKQLGVLFQIKPTPGYEPEYNDAVKEGRVLQEKIK